MKLNELKRGKNDHAKSDAGRLCTIQCNPIQSNPIHYNTGLIKQWSVSVEELSADSCPAEI